MLVLCFTLDQLDFECGIKPTVVKELALGKLSWSPQLVHCRAAVI